ncbi:MAG: hypothetical protein IT272_13670 [Chitinophagales bacterium]|nr:hypothetical protein [Sphingobacteriales bacterium]MBP9141528.1 hypothetical protein [Chitinophagales bacterium]MBK6891089.1 hypothetical protein [Sphingobacteriales bacterium]MBL0247780.1 hypothetical protein [Sphingobacteriales bacterium]MCC7058456.1 hypothetical protein [Chitinophagales bacterium]
MAKYALPTGKLIRVWAKDVFLGTFLFLFLTVAWASTEIGFIDFFCLKPILIK